MHSASFPLLRFTHTPSLRLLQLLAFKLEFNIIMLSRTNMRIKKCGNHYVVRIEKDEEIITALRHTAKKRGIGGAFFFGLGVGQDLVLGYFNAQKKAYIKKAFKGEYEFTNLSGNISKFRGEYVVHCHATITDNQFNAFGGHLFQGIVPATLEILIIPFSKTLRRKKDKVTGLNLLDC